MKEDLSVFISTYEGTIVMTEYMEKMALQISINCLPASWTYE